MLQKFKLTAVSYSISIVIAAGMLSGCVSESIVEREDIAIPPAELVRITDGPQDQVDCLTLEGADKSCRNQYIALKMFAIDQNFASYKILLSRGDAYENFGGDLAQIGLAGAASVLPVSQTTKVLSAASAAVGLTNTALNKDLLLSQTMQIIEQQMTTQRESVRQTIISRMNKCNVDQYPAGFVLSDLQSYADAGTVTSAINGIAKSTAGAQATTNKSSGTATPTTTSTTPDSAATSTMSEGANSLKTITYKSTAANCPLS